MICGWFLLESVKDQFLGVGPLPSPPLGQHVPSRVWYVTTCLLIRKLWLCVLFENNGEGYGYIWDPLGAREALEEETLAECKTDLNGPFVNGM
jgi:hypothetical protein